MSSRQWLISGTAAAALMVLAAIPITAQQQQPAAAVGGGFEWRLETPAAGWRPRDSSGEVVFKNRMWILGGWFDSYSPPPRDVWSSADGMHWEQVTGEAPWR
ncbi:MAG: hypothetical protein RLZZ458_3041, partial [Planctomycetota bacterium]